MVMHFLTYAKMTKNECMNEYDNANWVSNNSKDQKYATEERELELKKELVKLTMYIWRVRVLANVVDPRIVYERFHAPVYLLRKSYKLQSVTLRFIFYTRTKDKQVTTNFTKKFDALEIVKCSKAAMC